MRRALVVAAVLLAAAVAPAAAAPFDADDACRDGDDATVVGVLPGTDRRVAGSASLYAGTELRLVLCSNGNAEQVGSAWNLTAVPGLDVTGVADQHLAVTVTDDVDAVTVNASVVDGKRSVGALRVDVRRAPVADSSLVAGEIPFGSWSAARTYADREDDYVDALDGLNATAERLNATDDGDFDAAEAALDAVEANRTAVSDAGNLSATRRALERDLYRAAWHTDDGTPLAAIDALRGRSDASERRVEAALERYEATMQDRRNAARNDVLVDAAIGLVPGFVVGAAVAVGFLRRRKRRVSYDRKYTHVEFERSVLAWPALGALAVLLATLAAAYLFVPGITGVIQL